VAYGLVSIIIPKACPEDKDMTLAEVSLAAQDYPTKEFFVELDEKHEGAPVARNRGWKKASGEFLLFSDCDCLWQPTALSKLVAALRSDPLASYAYCAMEAVGCGYLIDKGVVRTLCMGPFTPEDVLKSSKISTMSLFRAAGFPGFDESIKRLQDWDLYLTLLERDKRLGVCVPEVLFRTAARVGITYGPKQPISCEAAYEIIQRKHGLL